MSRPNGYKHSIETKTKISLKMIGKKRPGHQEKWSGEKHWNWKGGNREKAWKKENKELVNFYGRTRRIRKSNALGGHTLGDWNKLKTQYNFTCPSCKKSEPEIKLTEDHIIPLTKGGSDNIENIQPLCKVCNSRKYTNIIKYEFILN